MTKEETVHGALEGIRVLDLTRVLSGPFSAMVLSDMGADVIKIEQPGKGDDTRQMGPFQNGQSMYYITNNRNKRGITLNLKAPEGKELFKNLVRQADVVVENFRPGTMEKLGLGYDVLEKINPRIIYGSISGFGHTGRYYKRPGYDIVAQAMSGVMSVTGWPDSGPTRTGTPLGDVISGLWLVIGILGAIQGRTVTGRGQCVDIALVDSAVSIMGNVNMNYLSKGTIPQRLGNRSSQFYPQDSFGCSDGDCVIATGNNKLWGLLCQAMEQPELAGDTAFDTVPKRVEHHEKVKQRIEAWSRQLSVQEVIDRCDAAGVPAAPIYNVAQVCHDPHIADDRHMFVHQQHPVAGDVVVTGSPLKLSGTPVQFKAAAPLLGQDNDDIYSRLLGLNEEQIKALKDQKII